MGPAKNVQNPIKKPWVFTRVSSYGRARVSKSGSYITIHSIQAKQESFNPSKKRKTNEWDETNRTGLCGVVPFY